MRLAIYQCNPLPLDVEQNLSRLEEQAEKAQAAGATLLVCPEMYLSGYNIGQPATARLAEPSDGASAQRIAEMARSYRLAILYGYPERSACGAIFNSAQLIDRVGNRLCNYRKTHLFGDLDRGMFSPGDALSEVVDLDGWAVSMLICYDVEFPENARRLAQAGAELILVPTANMAPYEFVAQVTVRSRAFENQCSLAYANYCGSEGEINYVGLSSVCSADGSVLSIAGAQEQLLIADIDRAKDTASRQLNQYLRDLRPDLYSACVPSAHPRISSLHR